MKNLALPFFLLLFTAIVSAAKDYSRHTPKLRCFLCYSPKDCRTGYCYGDVCVKTSANDHHHERYIAKGCENMTRSVTTDIYEPHMKHKSYCKTEIVLGIETTICYCRDGDYCNGGSMSFPSFVLFFLAVYLQC